MKFSMASRNNHSNCYLNEMKGLYVIGNGFDIHHGIPSRYTDFREWLEDNNQKLLSQMDSILGLCTEEWWNEFEANLGEVSNVKEFSEEVAFENQPDYMSDDFRSGDLDNARYEVKDKLGNLIDELKDCFQKWASLLPPGDDGEIVLVNTEDSFFLTFNYSLTLEKLYGIPPEHILHIHGSSLDKDSIVVGHGRPYDEIRYELDDSLPDPPDDVPIEEYSDWFQKESAEAADDYPTQAAKDEAADAIFSIHKDVEGIIERNSAFFNSLKDVERLHIYGLSFSDTDLPYLKAIFASIIPNRLTVEISWFSDKDKERIRRFMETVPKTKELRLMRLNEICRYTSPSLFEDN